MTKKITTIPVALALLGGVVGCGSSKPPAPASAAATTALARSPLSRCVQAWNEGAGEKAHMRIAGEAYPSDVATIATYGGTETTYDTLTGAEGASPAAWVTIEPAACIVVASFTIIVQQPDGSWAEPSDTPGYTRYFQPIAANGETWSTEHANVTVSPQHNIALETAGGQTPRPPGEEGRLTVMGGDQVFEMTAQEVAGDSYAEKQKTEAELAEDKTWAREQEQGKQSSTTPTTTSTKTCGTLTGFYGKAKVRVEGSVTCATARRVFRDYFAGGERKHQGSNHGDSYTAVDGWKCGTATGTSGCSRGGAFIQTVYFR